ncbi:hypothetical protein ABT158_16445 [Nonomuraea sp. NPDC001636]
MTADLPLSPGWTPSACTLPTSLTGCTGPGCPLPAAARADAMY